MLSIERTTYAAIVAHAKRDHPDEACGVVAGPEGSDLPDRFISMVNAAGSPTFYEFDPVDLLRLYQDMDARDHGNSEGAVEFRSYRIVNGEVTEEEISLVPSMIRSDDSSHDSSDNE